MPKIQHPFLGADWTDVAPMVDEDGNFWQWRMARVGGVSLGDKPSEDRITHRRCLRSR
jgi:hypothetical protein